jgi:hypothetical protein
MLRTDQIQTGPIDESAALWFALQQGELLATAPGEPEPGKPSEPDDDDDIPKPGPNDNPRQ